MGNAKPSGAGFQGRPRYLHRAVPVGVGDGHESAYVVPDGIQVNDG